MIDVCFDFGVASGTTCTTWIFQQMQGFGLFHPPMRPNWAERLEDPGMDGGIQRDWYETS